MNKIRFISFTASLVLAITFILSCEDKETKDKPAPAAVAVPETVAAVSENVSKIMYVNDVKGLNMRSEPSIDGVKLGALPYGTKIQVLEKSSTPVKIDEITDYWYKIDANVTLGGKVYKHSWVFGGFLSENPPKEGTFTDPRDGKKYKFVRIGEQVWMAENLNFAAKGSVCKDNNPDNCAKYGRLYDWKTAKKSCPKGWHLPSNEEWNKLFRFVDGDKGTESPYESKTAGKHLKAVSGWNDSGNGTDEFGFSALPGGLSAGGFFNDGGYGGYWWSTIEYEKNSSFAYYGYMSYINDNADCRTYSKSNLLSVRCIKD